MRLQALKRFAESLPHVTSVRQWGDCLVYKVAGKVFLVLVLDAETLESVTFKIAPEEFSELTSRDGISQAPYFAKRHWVRVEDLGILSAGELERRIQQSYALVCAKLPKRTQAALREPPPRG